MSPNSALIGQSAHGKNQVHRYYGHKQLVAETILCPVKRFSADEIEEAVISYLDKVIGDSGSMDKIESNIEKSIGSDKKAIMSEKVSLEKSIDRLKTEIESVFRLAGTYSSDNAGSELVHERLQALAFKKKTLEKESEEVEQAERNAALITRSKQVIEANILALKKGLRKAAPSLQKKLFSNLFNKLILTENGINIFYSLSGDAKNDGSSRNKKGPSVESDGPFFNFRLPCGVFASHGSPIVNIGGGQPTIVEHPLSTIRLYREKWIRDKIVIDQKTLARLRYQEGLTIRELSERYGLSPSSMKVRLYNLDRKGNKKKVG